jgi:hypothetical protein
MKPRRSTTTATREKEEFQRAALGFLLQDGGSWDEPLRLPQRKQRPLWRPAWPSTTAFAQTLKTHSSTRYIHQRLLTTPHPPASRRVETGGNMGHQLPGPKKHVGRQGNQSCYRCAQQPQRLLPHTSWLSVFKGCCYHVWRPKVNVGVWFGKRAVWVMLWATHLGLWSFFFTFYKMSENGCPATDNMARPLRHSPPLHNTRLYIDMSSGLSMETFLLWRPVQL